MEGKLQFSQERPVSYETTFALIGFLVLKIKGFHCRFIEILKNQLIKHFVLSSSSVCFHFMEKSEVLGGVSRRGSKV